MMLSGVSAVGEFTRRRPLPTAHWTSTNGQRQVANEQYPHPPEIPIAEFTRTAEIARIARTERVSQIARLAQNP